MIWVLFPSFGSISTWLHKFEKNRTFLFLKWNNEELKLEIDKRLDALVALKLLSNDRDLYKRPSFDSPHYLETKSVMLNSHFLYTVVPHNITRLLSALNKWSYRYRCRQYETTHEFDGVGTQLHTCDSLLLWFPLGSLPHNSAHMCTL